MLLFYTSFKDVKTRHISNWTCLAICVLAVIRMIFGSVSIYSAVIGCIFAAAPFFIADFIKFGSVGGGDIKLIGSCGLFLGAEGALFTLVVSCFLFLVITLVIKIKERHNKKESILKSMAFAPFITMGALIFYWNLYLPSIFQLMV